MVTTRERGASVADRDDEEIPPWPCPWTHSHELAEDVIAGGLLFGDMRLHRLVREEGYCFRGALRGRIARACLEWAASQGRFEDEAALARFLHERRAMRTVDEANLALAMIAAYLAWKGGKP